MRLQSRIEHLERQSRPNPEPMRVLRHIISPEAANARAQEIVTCKEHRSTVTFHRDTGESDDAFYQRIYTEMGWPEGYTPKAASK